jgi:hypothetical protein
LDGQFVDSKQSSYLVLNKHKTMKETHTSTPDEVVISKIYEIRGEKVMLDQDLAQLYNVQTKRLNEQVKRNLNRFPSDFMFQLDDLEWEELKSQFATTSWGRQVCIARQHKTATGLNPWL